MLNIIPNRLYHATHIKNLSDILDKGINISEIDDLVYLADSFGGAALFLLIRGVPKKDIIVIEVDTSLLDISLFEEGADHNTRIFKDVLVLTYPEHINDDCISGVYQFPIIIRKET